MDHIAFWVPVLVLTIAEDFDELLENRRMTAIASLSELCGVVEMAIHLRFVLVITVLGSKDCGTDRAGEMLNVIFTLQCGDVGSAKRATTCVANKVQTSKVIRLTKGVLSAPIFSINREEF